MIRLDLSGERFTAIYHLTGDAAEARAKAEALVVEQTVEFPFDLLPHGDIPEQIVGQIIALEPLQSGRYEATISYAIETAGTELTQLVNVLFGNISLLPGVRLVRFELPEALLRAFKGPRFGRAGLRALLHAPTRPLLATALKPMGLNVTALGDLAYRLAKGGADLIKDDHGIADQRLSPFEARVARCAEAVARANAETGGHSIYLPNVSAGVDTLRRAQFAKAQGAGGLLVAPGLVGLDTQRALAEDDALALPIMSHPALQGSYVLSADHGIGHGALFGLLNRLSGADVTIFPNYGGRFSFSQAECREIVDASAQPMGHLAPILPAPAGGMKLARVAEMVEFYGDDVVLLIGGDLHRDPRGVEASCQRFRALVS